MPRKKNIHYKAGPRKDIGPYNFRSSWEANVARILQYLGISFLFEPKRFYFDSYPDSYLPDFMLLDKNPWNCKWIEVKGLWHKGDKRKILLFNSEYPKQVLHVISRKEYLGLKKKYASLIKNWEK